MVIGKRKNVIYLIYYKKLKSISKIFGDINSNNSFWLPTYISFGIHNSEWCFNFKLALNKQDEEWMCSGVNCFMP